MIMLFKEIVDYYQQNAELVSREDPAAMADFEFYMSRCRPGFGVEHGSELEIMTIGAADVERDITTVVIDPNAHPWHFANSGGFASFGAAGNGLAAIMLRNVDVNPKWAGFVMRHELVHAQQHFTHGPQLSPLGEGMNDPERELEAYLAQMRSLDMHTDRRFMVALRNIARGFRTATISGLSGAQLEMLDPLIGGVRTEMEYMNREVFLTYAVNFVKLEERTRNVKKLKRARIAYLYEMFKSM